MTSPEGNPGGAGPSGEGRALVVVDLQRIVVPGAPWGIDGLRDILPTAVELVAAFGDRTVLTRHRIDPLAPGRWATLARRWADLEADPGLFALVDELAEAVPDGAAVVDKTRYSAFGLREVASRLDRGQPELVIAGCETDCCVAATMFEAVDAGVAVTLVDDAVVGPDMAGHDGLLAAAARLPEQVRVVPAAEAIASRFDCPPP